MPFVSGPSKYGVRGKVWIAVDGLPVDVVVRNSHQARGDGALQLKPHGVVVDATWNNETLRIRRVIGRPQPDAFIEVLAPPAATLFVGKFDKNVFVDDWHGEVESASYGTCIRGSRCERPVVRPVSERKGSSLAPPAPENPAQSQSHAQGLGSPGF